MLSSGIIKLYYTFHTKTKTKKLVRALLKIFQDQEIFSSMPYLMEYSMERAMKPGYAFSNEFAAGLKLMLNSFDEALRNES